MSASVGTDSIEGGAVAKGVSAGFTAGHETFDGLHGSTLALDASLAAAGLTGGLHYGDADGDGLRETGVHFNTGIGAFGVRIELKSEAPHELYNAVLPYLEEALSAGPPAAPPTQAGADQT